MISSYQFSSRFDTVSILAAGLSSLFALLRTLLLLLAVLAAGVLLAAVFALVFTFWLPIVQGVGCLAIIAAFAWATYPRSAVSK